MKNQRLLERKEELKKLATFIKKNKPVYWKSQDFRFLHIAYCIARGKDYLEIEQKTNNPISDYIWQKINTDIAYLREGFNEDVRTSA